MACTFVVFAVWFSSMAPVSPTISSELIRKVPQEAPSMGYAVLLSGGGSSDMLMSTSGDRLRGASLFAVDGGVSISAF